MSGNIILGVGINDSPTVIKTANWVCPYYQVWISMMKRCYSTKKPKTYINTTVCHEWLKFSNFKLWMINQEWSGKVLDKDLIGDGTLYSPNTCCFIYQKTNMFLSNTPLMSNHYRKSCKAWSVKVGKTYLGLFTSQDEADKVYKAEKYRQALEHSELYTCQLIKKALINKFKPE